MTQVIVFIISLGALLVAIAGSFKQRKHDGHS
jgi:hypothetical protein